MDHCIKEELRVFLNDYASEEELNDDNIKNTFIKMQIHWVLLLIAYKAEIFKMHHFTSNSTANIFLYLEVIVNDSDELKVYFNYVDNQLRTLKYKDLKQYINKFLKPRLNAITNEDKEKTLLLNKNFLLLKTKFEASPNVYQLTKLIIQEVLPKYTVNGVIIPATTSKEHINNTIFNNHK